MMSDQSTEEHATAGLSTPDTIVRAAEKIYREKYQEEYEKDHRGQYVVIDVRSEKAYLDDRSGRAIKAARQDSPNGIFHLMRVGSRAAFKTTRFSKPGDAWAW